MNQVTSRFSAPIVGMHFRPPAKAIIQSLPNECPLWLIPEPTNEYDANAVKVVVKSADIPEDQHQILGTLTAGYGFSLDEILTQPEWHLGYVKREYAAMIAGKITGVLQGQLRFSLDGAPVVEADIPA